MVRAVGLSLAWGGLWHARWACGTRPVGAPARVRVFGPLGLYVEGLAGLADLTGLGGLAGLAGLAGRMTVADLADQRTG